MGPADRIGDHRTSGVITVDQFTEGTIPDGRQRRDGLIPRPVCRQRDLARPTILVDLR
jgi:hypothetical protein